MAQRDADDDGSPRAITGAEIVMRAGWQRKRAAEYRARAVEHRSQAAADRKAAASDRDEGARDRVQALAAREMLVRVLAITETDPVTGARTRAAGLADLDHEIDRCHRTTSTLVVVYVHAVGLEHVNESYGHDAGDRLLRRVAALIAEHLRSYDLVVRVGGDEFLCAMTDMTLSDARERFSTIAGAVAASREAGALRAGFAELGPIETAAELVGRARGKLVGSRRD